MKVLNPSQLKPSTPPPPPPPPLKRRIPLDLKAGN